MSKPRVLRFGIQSLDKLIGSVTNPPLQTADITDLEGLKKELKDGGNEVSKYLLKRESLERESLAVLLGRGVTSQELVDELNEVLKDDDLYDKERFKKVKPSLETTELLDREPRDRNVQLFNRMLLEDTYRPLIAKRRAEYGIQLSERDDGSDNLPLTSSVCLTGPDGTGKSVFALHMASYYLADCLQSPTAAEECKGCPKILYISTDLTYKMALKAWNSFALDRPFERREPLIELKEGRTTQRSSQRRVDLKQYFPAADSSNKSIVNYLEGHAYEHSTNPPGSAEVCFVDLASRTAGDDWGFVHRLLSNLQEFGKDEPRHLVVLDAVEGFETLAGNVNAFGEKSTRRSRIAQVMRLATGKCHVIFVVEEGRDERLPEEFVTDVVIRLRSVGTPRYLRRTVEVEKARGQWHIRGQHPFAIRDGRGSTTGPQKNADEPEVMASGLFNVRDFTDAAGLINDLNNGKTALTRYLLQRFTPRTRELLEQHKSSTELQRRPDTVTSKLVEEFNNLLEDLSLYDHRRDKNLEAQEPPKAQIRDKSRDAADLIRLNRRLLEGEFPKRIATSLTHQSYVHVFPSLNYISREIMIDRYNPRRDPPEDKFAAFGIQYLDNMLAGEGEKAERREIEVAAPSGSDREPDKQRWEDFDTRGLPCGTTTALIGDSLTQKSQLGQAFLSRTFYKYAGELASSIKAAADANGKPEPGGDNSTSDPDAERARLVEQVSLIKKSLEPVEREFEPITLMFTTQSVTNKILVKEFDLWFEDRVEIDGALSGDLAHAKRWVFEDELRKQTLCRRFEIHDIPGPILMHIFQRNIEKAQRLMFKLEDTQPLPGQGERFQESWRIRVVIDDLNSFRNMFPEMREDPLMLPSLLSMLSREGVTALVIDTQTSGSPELSITERFDSSVRELVKHRIYTWRLPFYGENRVAIGLIPPISHEYRGIIRELRWETRGDSTSNRSLMIDPHFELYMGLEKGQPQPVPLEIRLYAEIPNFKKYIEAEESFFREVFTPVFSPASQDTPRVITWAEVTQYDALRDSSRLQRDTRLDHTTILLVDEFWWLRRAALRRAGAFRPQGSYLNAVTCTRDGDFLKQDSVADHFGVFQPPRLSEQGAPGDRPVPDRFERRDFFDDRCGYGFMGNDSKIKKQAPLIDRVPFTWDFGFLLCNETAWEEALDQEIGVEIRDFRASDFVDWPGLIKELKNEDNPVSAYLINHFVGDQPDLRTLLEGYKPDKPGQPTQELTVELVRKFSALLRFARLSEEAPFDLASLSEETKKFLYRMKNADVERPSRLQAEGLIRLNRLLLVDAYKPKIVRTMTVREVWDSLNKANEEPRRLATPVSWRQFLAASKVVAEHQSYRTSRPAIAFDFTMLSPESFSCLILEMWVSEINNSLNRSALRWASKEKAEKKERRHFPTFRRQYFGDATILIDKLREDGAKADPPPLSNYLGKHPAIAPLLLKDSTSNSPSEQILDALNKVLEDPELYEKHRFESTRLSKETLNLLQRNPPADQRKLNRMLLEDAYPNEITSPRNRRRHLERIKARMLDRVKQRRWHWEKPDSWEKTDTDDLDQRTLLVALEKEEHETLENILGQRMSGPAIHGYSLELYKVWLLLIETLNFAELVDTSSHLNFEFKSRDVSPLAVSARHWYRTACKFIDSLSPEQIESNWIPVRLPGHFSVRSDWFLAVAGGSRSNRLADQALDLLSSQRANVTRLQEGIGLPTRRLFDKDKKNVQLRTRLVSFPQKGAPLANVQYEKLREIGAQQESDQEEGKEEFYWLWRSGIWAYNRHSRIWHKWLNRTFLKWHSWRQRFGSKWTSGFEVYDLLSRIEFEGEDDGELKDLNLESWNQFHELRDILISELEQVSTSEADVSGVTSAVDQQESNQ